METFYLRTQVPRIYGESLSEQISSEYLPITGGTMLGNINMNGNKIINVGQNNLEAGDIVTLGTVQSLINSSKIMPSMSLATFPGSTAFDSAVTNSVILPGILNDEGRQLESNWGSYTDALVDGYFLGSNNVPGLPTSAKVYCKLLLEVIGSQGAVIMILTDRLGSVFGSAGTVVQEGSVTPIELILSLPSAITDLSPFQNFLVSIRLSLDGPCTVNHELISLHYLLSY